MNRPTAVEFRELRVVDPLGVAPVGSHHSTGCLVLSAVQANASPLTNAATRGGSTRGAS